MRRRHKNQGALLLLLLFAIWGCSTQENQTQKQLGSERNGAGDPLEHAAKEFVCSPENLASGDVLRLEFPIPHGQELAIVDPEGTFFFVAYKNLDTRSPLRPRISSQEFAKLSFLEFAVDTLTAHPWVARATQYRRVFSVSGDYVIRVGDVLESDASHVLECTVTFTANVAP